MHKILPASRLAKYIQRIYPRQLAGSWDNTGLLLESSFTRSKTDVATRVLLCIDLTTQVCEEALALEGCAHIITYHPIIFSGLKSLTLKNAQQRSLLRLSAAGISVYSPHTAVDAVKDGVNDMLVSLFRNHECSPINITSVEPSKNNVPGFEGAGMGRKFDLSRSIDIDEAVLAVKKGLMLEHVQLCTPQISGTHGHLRAPSAAEKNIKTVGVCAGSGGSVLAGLDVDLIVTGELSHHEQLALVARGVYIILCGHSNTERPFLTTMKAQLEEVLQKESDEKSNTTEFVVSTKDASPFVTV